VHLIIRPRVDSSAEKPLKTCKAIFILDAHQKENAIMQSDAEANIRASCLVDPVLARF
jgi:hypothetical protein